jgi:hypothetical protein
VPKTRSRGHGPEVRGPSPPFPIPHYILGVVMRRGQLGSGDSHEKVPTIFVSMFVDVYGCILLTLLEALKENPSPTSMKIACAVMGCSNATSA